MWYYKYMIIYKITNLINSKVYIGQTIRPLSHRWTQHLREVRDKLDYRLYRSIRKYGIENFKVEEIDGANNQTELNYKEWLWIMKTESYKPENGYNLKLGGAKGKASEETKKKTSETLKRIGHKPPTQSAKDLRYRGMLQHQDPNKRINFLLANGSRYFKVYKAILVRPYRRGPAGGEGIEAIYEKGEYIGEWVDTAKCAEELGLKKYSSIARCLRKERKTYQNYIFE